MTKRFSARAPPFLLWSIALVSAALLWTGWSHSTIDYTVIDHANDGSDCLLQIGECYAPDLSRNVDFSGTIATSLALPLGAALLASGAGWVMFRHRPGPGIAFSGLALIAVYVWVVSLDPGTYVGPSSKTEIPNGMRYHRTFQYKGPHVDASTIQGLVAAAALLVIAAFAAGAHQAKPGPGPTLRLLRATAGVAVIVVAMHLAAGASEPVLDVTITDPASGGAGNLEINDRLTSGAPGSGAAFRGIGFLMGTMLVIGSWRNIRSWLQNALLASGVVLATIGRKATWTGLELVERTSTAARYEGTYTWEAVLPQDLRIALLVLLVGSATALEWWRPRPRLPPRPVPSEKPAAPR